MPKKVRYLTFFGFFFLQAMKVIIYYNAVTAGITELDSVTTNKIYQALSYEDPVLKDKLFRARLRNPNVWFDTYQYLFDQSNLSFPTGMMVPVIKILHRAGYEYSVKPLIEKVVPDPNHQLPNWLWPHQKEAISNALKYKRAVMELPTASGKSVIIAEFLACFEPDVHALVVVPEVQLMHQIAKTCEESLGETIGLVGGGKNNWERVTVGLPGSMKKYFSLPPDENPLNKLKVLVFDECHTAAAPGFINLADNCPNTYYRIGLTATFERSDGKEILANSIIGQVEYKISEEQLFGEYTMKPDYLMLEYDHQDLKFSGYITGEGDYEVYNPIEGPSYNTVYSEAIVRNYERAELIVDLGHQITISEKRVGCGLILVKQSEHAALIQEIASSKYGYDWRFIDQRVKPKDRITQVEEMNQGLHPITIGCNVFNQGINIKSLEYVINAAGGGANSGLIFQKIGRTNRKSDLKERCIFIDIADQCKWYLTRQTQKRALKVDERFAGCRRYINLPELIDFL